MNYFVTGITGFIGQQFLEYLSKREGTIYALVREGSEQKLSTLVSNLGLPSDKVYAVSGDLSQPLCGVLHEKLPKIDAMYHLGAVYDLAADEDSQQRANIMGTEEAIKLAKTLDANCFHHISSIVAAGFYKGEFTESMFDEAVDVDKNAYFLTKHLSEKIIREKCEVPYRIYRPGVVVGSSKTGWINKIDGPYYFFNIINTISEVLPRWTPLPRYKGNNINIVPVDFVAAALDHISHKEGLDGKCFHLTDPDKSSFGDVINEFLIASKGPSMNLDLPAERLLDFLPMGPRIFLENKTIVGRVKSQFLENLGIPKEVLLTEELDTTFDCSNTLEALEGSGIKVPRLETYAARLWNYWEQKLNPALTKPNYLSDVVAGKTVLITGGSEGIGLEVANNCVDAGAKVIIVARTQSKLDSAVDELSAKGGDVYSYSCDLSDLNSCDELTDKVLADHGYIDVLINNAGRSIRRSLNLTYNRFHDFERVMQVNYFSAIRLAMNLLPSMVERQSGHIVNISSIVSLGKGSPRFSSYVASKSALDAWSDSAGLEYAQDNIQFTNVHMPLVRTKMIEATTSYQDVNVLSPKEAGELINGAIVHKPTEVNTMTGNFLRQLGIWAPKLNKLVFSTLYQITDDSEAAKASAGIKRTEDSEAIKNRAMGAIKELQLDKETFESIANLLRGYHA